MTKHARIRPIDYRHSFSFVFRYPFEHISQLPSKPFCFTQRYQDVKKVLADTFFGPPDVGVYSPSVQNTLYLMAREVLTRFVALRFGHYFLTGCSFLSAVFSPYFYVCLNI